METVEIPVPNHVTEQLPELVPPRLGAASLRRLQRLQMRVDGATEVAQAAVNAHNAVREAYQTAFLAACEDSSIEVPPGPHEADIDWHSGTVKFVPNKMADYNIGPGVQQAMADAGDEPRSDEQFVILTANHKVSQTFGRDAVYYWLEEDNRTSRCPF